MTPDLDIEKTQNLCDNLLHIGQLLYSETNLHRLLEKITDVAMNITCSEGGSLYVREDKQLIFYLAKNRVITGNKFSYINKRLPIDKTSLAGYVASTGEILNIEDAYNLDPSAPYTINLSYDQENHYHTKSVLMLPLKDMEQKVIGVLQLINTTNDNGLVSIYTEDEYDALKTLTAQAAIALKNNLLVKEIKDAYLDTIYRLAMAAELKDTDTFRHLKAVSMYSRIIAAGLGLSEEEQEYIEYAAPMHDIGKIGIPDRILKKPGILTDEERKIMEQHTEIGSSVFKDARHPILKYSYEISLAHHEKFDGSGYPNHLKGEAIPISARIVALADVYDALKAARCYKPPFPDEKVMDIIQSSSGKHFDPACIDSFLQNLDKIKNVGHELDQIYGK